MVQLLDVRTLFVIWFIVCAVLSIDMTLFWLNHRSEKGIGFWVLGLSMTTIGASLFIFRGMISGFLSIVIANSLSVLSWSLISRGIRFFFKLEKGLLWEILPVLSVIFGFTYYTYADPNIVARIIIISVIFSIQMLRSLYLLNKKSNLEPSVKSISAEFSILLLSVFFISRAVLALFDVGTPNTQSFLSPNLMTVTMFLLLIIVYISLTIGLISMPGQRNRIRLLEASSDLKESNLKLQRSNQELEQSNTRFQSFYNASFEGIVFIENGIIIDANKKCEEIFGYKLSELVGMHAIEFVHSEQKAIVAEKISIKYNQPYQTIIVGKDNREIYVELHGNNFNYGGRNIRITAIRDLSEKLRAEAEIKKLQGIIPICSYCKEIRDDKGAWKALEEYIQEHSEALFSHGICVSCLKKHHPDISLD